MESIGRQLRAARESKGLTTSQLAAALNSKQQTVEEAESDRFDRMPAHVYARGFIRAYAEYVGIDVPPLLDAYVAQYQKPASRGFAKKPQSSLRGAPVLAPRKPLSSGATPASDASEDAGVPAPVSRLAASAKTPPSVRRRRVAFHFPARALRATAIAVGILALLTLAGFGLNRAIQASFLRGAQARSGLVCMPPPPFAP